jgi:hypothetical protein
MRLLNAFVVRTIKPLLIVFGLATCAPLPIAMNIDFITPMLGGVVDYTPSSVPALRHWAFMIFGVGVLMVIVAFRPWLRFETMLFSSAEKSFMVYLFLSNLDQPGIKGYLGGFLLDSTIVAYSVLYFISDQGRPKLWTPMK